MVQENDFTVEKINLSQSYDGEPIASFISANANIDGRNSILYIHGYIDYFFQYEMTDSFLGAGYNFYALDLRRYGRSLLPHQYPNYCRSMDEYEEEINIALQKIIERNPQKKIILLGHSTGGLLAVYYMIKGKLRDKVDLVMLNSPFFELPVPLLLRKLALPLAKLVSSVSESAKIEGMLASVYAKSLHKDYGGEWDFDTRWKPIKGFPTYFSWLKAIIQAQTIVKKEANLTIPVLLMSSQQSYLSRKYSSKVHESDTVLNVKHIDEIGKTIGNNVEYVPFKGGLHDLVLSRKEVRDRVIHTMILWINKNIGV